VSHWGVLMSLLLSSFSFHRPLGDSFPLFRVMVVPPLPVFCSDFLFFLPSVLRIFPRTDQPDDFPSLLLFPSRRAVAEARCFPLLHRGCSLFLFIFFFPRVYSLGQTLPFPGCLRRCLTCGVHPSFLEPPHPRKEPFSGLFILVQSVFS